MAAYEFAILENYTKGTEMEVMQVNILRSKTVQIKIDYSVEKCVFFINRLLKKVRWLGLNFLRRKDKN